MYYICKVKQLNDLKMKHVETNQITFGKETKKLISELVPTAKHIIKIGQNVLIKDLNGQTVATWQKRTLKNGLLIIW